MSKLHFDFDQISPKLRKKLVLGSVIPRPIAWISTQNKNGTSNLAPFSFFNMFSGTVLGVSFQKMKNENKDTYENLIREKQGVVHIVGEDLIETMDLSSQLLSNEESEINHLNIKTSASQKVNAPTVSDSMVSMEVVLLDDIELLNYEQTEPEANLLLLRVIAMSVNNSVFDSEKEYILGDKLKPLSRLGGPQYGKTGFVDYKRKF